jgi:hypothetical protein
MLRIKELNGFRISPNGLGFFEPNSMFPEIGSVFVLIPFESHIQTVFYSIYSQIPRKSGGGKTGLGIRVNGPPRSQYEK